MNTFKFQSDFGHFRSAIRQPAVAHHGADERSQSRRAIDRIFRHASRGRCPSRTSRTSRSRSNSVDSEGRSRSPGRDRARDSRQHSQRFQEFHKPAPEPPTIATFIQHAQGEGRGRAQSLSRRNENRSCSRPRQPSPAPLQPARFEIGGASSSHLPAPRNIFEPPSLGHCDVTGLTSTIVCAEYRAGRCTFGDQCAYAHPSNSVNSINVGTTLSQGQRKQMKKQANQATKNLYRKTATKEDEDGRIANLRKKEALRKFEAQLQKEGPLCVPEPPELHSENQDPVHAMQPTLAAPELLAPSFDDIASLDSASTGRILRFDLQASNYDAESIADVSDVAHEDTQRKLINNVFLDEPWNVLLSDNSFATLQNAGKQQLKGVLQILKGLASGRWLEAYKQELGTHGPLKLRCAQCGELAVLWGVDMEYSQERRSFVEVLQIWDIVSRDETEKAASVVLHEWRQSKRSFQGLAAALRRQGAAKDAAIRLPRVVGKADLQDGDVFSVRKFFSLDGNMLRCLLYEDSDRHGTISASEQFILRISKQEAAVVEKKGPMIVIGRSGSGKTLCCVYRMFFQYTQYWKQARLNGGAPYLPTSKDGEGLCHLHQVFVTHSMGLANKVLEYFSNLQQTSQEGARSDRRQLPGTSLVEQTRLPDNIRGVQNFPLFVTFRKLLIMIDGSCRTPFFPRRHTGAVHPDKVIMAESPDAMDPISALREQRQAAQRAHALGRQSRRDSQDKKEKVLTEVNYDVFKERFWPKICQKVPSGCDASLVWREIQTFIKGSYKVLDGDKGFLEIADYSEVAKKCSPGFQEYRKQIYEAFEVYERLRKDWNCFDRMDACFHVIKQLRQEPYTGPPVHSVAVDEVQDLGQLELAVFFLVMRRPYEELFITGDTSQTVSRAVDFRFCDLRSLFHHFGVPPPELDQLVINYRSHQKILALTHLGVVRPLEIAFPHAIDPLKPDFGHRDGPKPIVVTDVKLEDLAQHLFNLDGTSTGIAFGASQSILVRSDDSKQCLPTELSKALVLTVEQSKGLEFDDCIMVNFFKDSTYKDWQVMLNFQEELLGFEQESQSPKKRPNFERYRHTLLCSELKHLYTAMTRTKNVLLIIEQDFEQAQSVFELWNALGLVSFGLLAEENLEAISQLISRAGSSKGKESWSAMGFNLLQKQLIEQAKSAFARAGDEKMVSTCEAYLVAQQAAKMILESEAEGMKLYLRAATLFEAAGQNREQAECLLLGDEPLKAARIFVDMGCDFKADAARAYSQAGSHRAAGKLYEDVGNYREALESLILADLMEEVKRVVLKAHEEKALNGEECFRYLQDTEAHDVAAEIFFRDGIFDRAASCFQSAGLIEREAECYEMLNQPLRAAKCLSTSNEPMHLRRAAELYVNLKDESNAAVCYRSLLKVSEGRDRSQLLQLCASLYENSGDPASAAEFWEQLGDVGSLERAAACLQPASPSKDFARVIEKLAAESMGSFIFMSRFTEKVELLRMAAQSYEHAACPDDAIRIMKDLEQWSECARIAQKLANFYLAAHYYHLAGSLLDEIQCRMKAGEFQAAFDLLPKLPRSHPELEIDCLAKLGRYNEAARRQMQILPAAVDDKSQESRRKLALKAFDIAKKDKSTWKDFLAEFEREIPDATSLLLFFAELGDAHELSERLQKIGEPVAAIAAASILGEPEMALGVLFAVELPEEESYVDIALDILLLATSQKLDSEKYKAILPYLGQVKSWISDFAESWDESLYFDYVSAVLQRLANQNKKEREAAMILRSHTDHSSWKSRKLSRAFRFRIEEEVALASSGKARDAHRSVHEHLLQSRRIAESDRLEEWMDNYYHMGTRLHVRLLTALEECLKTVRRPSFSDEWSQHHVFVPTSHVMCQKLHSGVFEVVAEFPGASIVLKKDLRTVILNDLASKQLQLLSRLSEISDDSVDAFTVPDLWLKAYSANSIVDLDIKLYQGFASNLKLCARRWADKRRWDTSASKKMLEQISGDVIEKIPEVAEGLWDEVSKSSDSILRKTHPEQNELQHTVKSIQNAVKDLVCMYLMLLPTAKTCKKVIQAVTELVFKGLPYLMPICPDHVESKSCKREGCTLDHPEVPKTTSPWLLLNLENNPKHPGLRGIGLQAWIDVVSRCWDLEHRRCWKSAKECKWRHPTDNVLQELRKTSYYGQKKDGDEKAAKAFIKCQGGHASSLPTGFGYTFFPDEVLTHNVRMVAILADALVRDALVRDALCIVAFSDIRDVLLRMCRAIYRFPEQHAATMVKRTLEALRFEDLRHLSYDITWEVDGCPEETKRCLLSEVLNKKNPGKHTQAPTQRVRPVVSSNLTANANVFVPGAAAFRILQRPQVNQWEQGNARDLLFKPVGQVWVPKLPARGASSSTQ